LLQKGSRTVPLDSRLRLERKFEVEISTKESWEVRIVTTREEMQCGKRVVTVFQAELCAILEVATSKEVTEGL